MITLNVFIKNIYNITNSLVIKLSDLASHMNYVNSIRYGLDFSRLQSSDKATWKYYLNLNGEYHTLDSDIFLIPLETNVSVKLTKTSLELYPRTWGELLSHGEYFKNLILNYPEQELLIRGIIQPVDIQTAIDAEDGTILAYDDNLIEPQELSLIVLLEQFIKNHLRRWHIREYTITDNLYMAGMLGSLFSAIILKINNIRLDKILTSETHSYHIYEFFRSHHNIAEEAEALSPDIRLWLYMNLRYIERNMGKDKTFQLLIDNVLTPSGVGIGNILLTKSDPVLDTPNLNNINSSTYNPDTNIFVSKALNDNFIIRKDERSSIKDILIREINDLADTSHEIINDADVYEKIVNNDLRKNAISLQTTKILELDEISEFKLTPGPRAEILIDNWVYYTLTGAYNPSIEFTDPNTNILYSIDSYTAILIFFKLLASTHGVTNLLLDGYHYNNVLDDTVSKTELSTALYLKDDMSTVIDYILSVKPVKYPFVTTFIFNSYIKDLLNYNAATWEAISNVNNLGIATDLKVVVNKLNHPGYIDLTTGGVGIDVNAALAAKGIILNITNTYNIGSTTNELIKAFTGFEPSSVADLIKSLTQKVNIVKKLTSYSVQFLYNINIEEPIYVSYSATNVMGYNNPQSTIVAGIFKCLEDVSGSISAETLDIYYTLLAIHSKPSLEANLGISMPKLIAYTDSIVGLPNDTLLVEVDNISIVSQHDPIVTTLQ